MEHQSPPAGSRASRPRWTALLAVLAGCASPGPDPASGPLPAPADSIASPDSCTLGAAVIARGDTVVIAVSDADPFRDEYRALPTGDCGTLIFQPFTGDERDLLARGVEGLITRDPATRTYARGLPAYAVTPLVWDRTYLLVASPPLRFDTGADSASVAAFRAALARDAVATDARGAEPIAMADGPGCRGGEFGLARPRPRIAYRSGDRTARELAERLVALAPASSGPLTTAGLTAEELARSVSVGADAGAIVSISRLDSLPCSGLPPAPASATMEPLVDTRAHLVLRRSEAAR